MALQLSSALLFRTLGKMMPRPSPALCSHLVPLHSSSARCLGTWYQRKTLGRSAGAWWPCRLPLATGRVGATVQDSHIDTPSPLLLPVNTMKKRTAIKRRCKDCKIVIKNKRAYVICKTSPRHNQVQG